MISDRSHNSQTDDSLDQYFYDISNTNQELLTREQEQALAVRIKEGDNEALDELVTANLRFVINVAVEYKNKGLPLADLVSEGNAGLIIAAKKFDGTRGVKFISYAVWWIRQAILYALSSQSRTIRLPLNCIVDRKRINKTLTTLEQSLGRPPTIEEVACELGMDLNDINSLLTVGQCNISTEEQLYENEPIQLLTCFFVENRDNEPDRVFAKKEAQKKIKAVLRLALNEREASVLRLYFGLDGEKELNLHGIGVLFGMSRERVRQIKERALKKLCSPRWLLELSKMLK